MDILFIISIFFSVFLGFAITCFIFAVILSRSNDIGNSTGMVEDYKIDISFDDFECGAHALFFEWDFKEIAPDSIPVNVLHPIEGTPLYERGVLDPERVVDSVAVLRLVNPSTPLRFAGGRRDMSDETAAKCIYVGMSAGIAGPLLTTPGADFDDDRSLAVRAGFSVGRRQKR